MNVAVTIRLRTKFFSPGSRMFYLSFRKMISGSRYGNFAEPLAYWILVREDVKYEDWYGYQIGSEAVGVDAKSLDKNLKAVSY